MSANFFNIFCKPCKINGLQAFFTLEIVIFLRFDTNLTPIFSFLVSKVHCHTIQLCYLVFNPCPVAQVVIHFHSHIKMSVSHNVLQYLNVHTALCHSRAGCVSHNMSGNLWKQFCFPVFFLCLLDFRFVISVYNVIAQSLFPEAQSDVQPPPMPDIPQLPLY